METNLNHELDIRGIKGASLISSLWQTLVSGSLLPSIIQNGPEIQEVISCESISTSTDTKNRMPKRLSLTKISLSEDGKLETFMADYVQQNNPNKKDVRSYNVGDSNYAEHTIQPWDIWYEYNLNPWDADIVKRVLRTKKGEPRHLDYQKIIHICNERIRQLEMEGSDI